MLPTLICAPQYKSVATNDRKHSIFKGYESPSNKHDNTRIQSQDYYAYQARKERCYYDIKRNAGHPAFHAKNRWVGAYWQSKGLTVYPTIAWSTPRSFEFCFDGVEQNGIVAVGMIGCRKNKTAFMRGYNAMLEKLLPETVIVFGTPFPEMKGNIITVDYRQSRRVVR